MRTLVTVVLVLGLVACTSQEDMTLLHREITDVQRQVQQLQDSTLGRSDLATVERQFQEASEQTLRSNADLTVRVEQLQEQIEALHASLELTTRQLQSISQELAAARAHVTALPPVTAVGEAPEGAAEAGGEQGEAGGGSATFATTSPEELYRTAYEDYMRGNYDLAAQGFREYLRRWGTTDLADNALYWTGECYDALGNSDEALEVFSEVLERYPASDKAAAAQLKKGLIYLKNGDQGQGVVHLQYVVYEHPGSQEADLAREKLRTLGLTIR
jgi:tol-pal system protein YbgF